MKLWITAAAVSVASMAALAPASHATTVCNQAENSPRGGDWVVVDGTAAAKPGPARQGTPMKVGNDSARGLRIAVDRSPALALCGKPSSGGGGGDDGSGGSGGGTGSGGDGGGAT